MSEAKRREQKQTAMYEKILGLINDQFENNDIQDSAAFLLSLSNVQTIISEANRELRASPLKSSPRKSKQRRGEETSFVLSKVQESSQDDLLLKIS